MIRRWLMIDYALAFASLVALWSSTLVKAFETGMPRLGLLNCRGTVSFLRASVEETAGPGLDCPPVDGSVVTAKELLTLESGRKTREEVAEEIGRTRYLYPRHVEVVRDFEDYVDETVDRHLLETGEASWQPQDFLPDMAQEGCMEELKEFREKAATVSDEALVVLIGDMVTEEALPTYQTLLNTFEGCGDPSGTTENAWARWSRGWTSEENRHGDLLNKYLYLGGRCDMRKVEVTIQHLITNGFNPGAAQDPYRGFIYTSFQERATKISHFNMGAIARKCGDNNLAKICSKIAADEGRHEKAYQGFCDEVIKRDIDGFIEVFADMMRGQIIMPAELMTDGVDDDLYDNFASVAQRLKVYTAIDYAEILGYLMERWDMEHMTGLSPESEKNRDFLCNLPRRYKRLAERSMNKQKKDAGDVVQRPFSWIYGRLA